MKNSFSKLLADTKFGQAAYAIETAPTIELKFQRWREAAHEFEQDCFPLFQCTWLEKNNFKVFVRWTTREINQQERRSLDIASVEIPANKQRNGWFRDFMRIAYETKGIDGVYVESVNTKKVWLHEALKRWGFIEVSSSCYWRTCQDTSNK